MAKKYILAFDSGTTSVRCMLFNAQGEICATEQKEITQYYPRPGWVEHDALEIWERQLDCAHRVINTLGISAEEIAAIGITNQRETAIVWDKVTGKPLCNAIVWQCRRCAKYCERLKADGYGEIIKKKTGLIPDSYFSGAKIRWILENVDGARAKAAKGELCFGTVDTWLLWNLTGGRVHATDMSNACRTMLYNIHTLEWDGELCSLLNVPMSMLPKVCPSSHIFGETELFGAKIPIGGIAGDQQSALFGHTCFNAGDVKNTYGTGCFMLMNIGETPVESESGLVTTIAWGIGDKVFYALEGSVFVAGAVVQWLRDEMGLIKTSAESEEFASRVSDTGGCYFVPAFTGLGAPYWNSEARGTIFGLSRGTNKCHIIRAALESMAYQSYDVLCAMEKDSGLRLTSLFVDGGASANDFLMRFQADVAGLRVVRPFCVETTATGAAFLAGLSVGFWKDLDQLCAIVENKGTACFENKMSEERRWELLDGWHRAVKALI